MSDNKTVCYCVLCGVLVPEKSPEFCCSGRDCMCAGLPILQATCKECQEILDREAGSNLQDFLTETFPLELVSIPDSLRSAGEVLDKSQSKSRRELVCRECGHKWLTESEYSQNENLEPYEICGQCIRDEMDL